jgi:UDP-N-acetylmuramoylalanine--D-glutamate ligase
MGAFAEALPRAVIGVPGNGPKVLEVMRAAGIRPVDGLHAAPDLASAVNLARSLCRRGGVVLLSPGAPSFPEFRDFRDRGRQFAGLCGLELAESDAY